jgi:hypothetical protein
MTDLQQTKIQEKIKKLMKQKKAEKDKESIRKTSSQHYT